MKFFFFYKYFIYKYIIKYIIFHDIQILIYYKKKKKNIKSKFFIKNYKEERSLLFKKRYFMYLFINCIYEYMNSLYFHVL